MIKPPIPKPGRPRSDVRDPKGNIVPYLGSYERKNRKGKFTKTVYYSYWLDKNDKDKEGNPKIKKYYYKKSYPAVIIEHNQRMAEFKDKKEYIKFELKLEEKQELALKFYREQQDYQYASSQLDGDWSYKPNYDLEIEKHTFLANVRRFLSDPVKAAEELGDGWEQIRKLKDLPIHENKVSLQKLFDFYIERKNPCGQEKRGQKSAWNFFKAMIGEKCISEVSEEDISQFYKKTVNEVKKRKKVKNRNLWVRTKYMKIKTVLNTCKQFMIPQNADVERVIVYWERHIKLPDTEVFDKPRAITKDEFSKLVKNSNLKYQTIYYLAVNCFFYAGDFPYLLKNCIFKQGGHTFIRMPRNKEQRRFERLNCLAPETEKLLNEYMKSEPNDTEFVFNGEKSNGTPNGQPISAKGIREYHKALCEDVGICGVGFRHCRDAVTHIRKLHPDIQNLSLGHKVSDEQRVKYIEDMIDDAIEPMEVIRKTYYTNET